MDETLTETGGEETRQGANGGPAATAQRAMEHVAESWPSRDALQVHTAHQMAKT